MYLWLIICMRIAPPLSARQHNTKQKTTNRRTIARSVALDQAINTHTHTHTAHSDGRR